MSTGLAMVHAKLMPNAWSASFCRRKAAAVMEPGSSFAICGLWGLHDTLTLSPQKKESSWGLVLSQWPMACLRREPPSSHLVSESATRGWSSFRLSRLPQLRKSPGWIRIRSVLLFRQFRQAQKSQSVNIWTFFNHNISVLSDWPSSFIIFWEEGVKFYHFLYDDFFWAPMSHVFRFFSFSHWSPRSRASKVSQCCCSFGARRKERQLFSKASEALNRGLYVVHLI